MKSIFRSVLVALVAVFALSVVGTVSASAAVCHASEHGGTVGLCIEKAKITGTKVAFTTEKLAGTGGVNIRKVEGYATVTCEKSKGNGIYNTAGPSLTIETLKVEYSNCKVVGQPECEVPPVIAEATGSFQGENTGQVKLTGAKKSETFAELTITGVGCLGAVEGSKIQGKLTCGLPSSEEELQIHTMECLESGNGLRWAGHQDRFSLKDTLKLDSNKLWGLMVS